MHIQKAIFFCCFNSGGKILENEEKLNIATKTKLARVQSSSSIEVGVDNGKINKVLTLSSSPIVKAVQVENAQVKFDGEIVYNLLSQLDSGEIVSLTEKAPFSQVVESEQVSIGDVALVKGTTQEVSSSFVGDELKLSSVIDFSVCIIKQNSDLSCATKPDDVFTKEEEIYYNTLSSSATHDFSIDFDLPKDAKMSKVLLVKSSPFLKSIIPSSDYFVASGNVYSSVVYQTEDGNLKSTIMENTFTEEIACEGCTKDSIVQGFMSAHEAIIESNDNAFNVQVPLCITSQVYSQNSANCIVDAYCLHNQVNLTTTSFEQDDFLSTTAVEENLLTSFNLEQNLPSIDKILAIVPLHINVTNQVVKGGEILLEGVASFNIVYSSEDDDGNKQTNSVDVEVPYSKSFSVPEVEEGDNVGTSIAFGNINVKTRHGRELEILIELLCSFNISRSKMCAITTDISFGEEKPKRTHALEIYCASDGESLWDIAKKLNMSVSDIMSQNPNLSSPIKHGEKIVTYTQEISE